jgi:hypothetical protein
LFNFKEITPFWVKTCGLYLLALSVTSLPSTLGGTCISKGTINYDECEAEVNSKSFPEVPDEVLLHVFTFLDPRSLAAAGQVDQRLKVISQDERLLRPFFKDGLNALKEKEYEKARALILSSAKILTPQEMSQIFAVFEPVTHVRSFTAQFVSWYQSFMQSDPISRFFTAEIVSLYQETAEKGDSLAQRNLGHMYDKGLGVTQDLQKAIHYFTLAADQGNVEAQLTLGSMHVLGEGVPTDLEKAIHYFTLAADQGNAEAQEFLRLLL